MNWNSIFHYFHRNRNFIITLLLWSPFDLLRVEWCRFLSPCFLHRVYKKMAIIVQRFSFASHFAAIKCEWIKKNSYWSCTNCLWHCFEMSYSKIMHKMCFIFTLNRTVFFRRHFVRLLVIALNWLHWIMLLRYFTQSIAE